MTTLTRKEQELIARQERLQQQLEQTKQALAQKERQRAKRERELERARDTRRRILIGAHVLTMKKPEDLAGSMDGYLKRADDRALFGLPPLPPKGGDEGVGRGVIVSQQSYQSGQGEE